MLTKVVTDTEAQEKRIDEDWGSLTWLAGRKQGNAEGLTLGRVIIKVGFCNPRHIHGNCEEVLYLMKGKLEHTLGDEKVVLEAGDTITIPKGAAHNAVSVGDEDADMIVVYDSADRGFKVEE